MLLVIAFINLFASFGYLVGGGLTTAAADMGDAMAQGIAEAAKAHDPNVAVDAAEIKAGAKAAKTVGGALMGFGAFLLLVTGLEIAGGVCLFRTKAKTFVLVAAGLGVLAEIIGILVTTLGITNLIGIVACVLAIIAASQYQTAAQEA